VDAHRVADVNTGVTALHARLRTPSSTSTFPLQTLIVAQNVDTCCFHKKRFWQKTYHRRENKNKGGFTPPAPCTVREDTLFCSTYSYLECLEHKSGPFRKNQAAVLSRPLFPLLHHNPPERGRQVFGDFGPLVIGSEDTLTPSDPFFTLSPPDNCTTRCLYTLRADSRQRWHTTHC
jgi:hypothetical protein